jgi:hypothetical protein
MTGSFSENLSQRGSDRVEGVSCDSSRFAPYIAFTGITVSAVLIGESASFPPCAAEFSLVV